MKHKTLSTLIFLLAEGALGVAIQLTGGRLCALLSFGSILLAFGMIAIRHTPTTEWRLTALALFLTLCADTCLVLCDPPQRLLGMIFFLGVQACYFRRTHILLSGGARRASLYSHAALAVLGVVLPLLVLGKGADALSIVSIVYVLNLLDNIIFAFLVKSKTSILLPLGLVLFILCDLFVGFGMLETYLPLAPDSFFYHLAHPSFNVAWAFYVPAQTLLALSTPWQSHKTKKD